MSAQKSCDRTLGYIPIFQRVQRQMRYLAARTLLQLLLPDAKVRAAGAESEGQRYERR